MSAMSKLLARKLRAVVSEYGAFIKHQVIEEVMLAAATELEMRDQSPLSAVTTGKARSDAFLPPEEYRCAECAGYGDVAGGKALCSKCSATGIRPEAGVEGVLADVLKDLDDARARWNDGGDILTVHMTMAQHDFWTALLPHWALIRNYHACVSPLRIAGGDPAEPRCDADRPKPAREDYGKPCIHFPTCGCGGEGIVDSACWPQYVTERATSSSSNEEESTLNELPPPDVLWWLGRQQAVKHPEDWEAGKKAQLRYGLEKIPPNYEYEGGYGLWQRLRAAFRLSAITTGKEKS